MSGLGVVDALCKIKSRAEPKPDLRPPCGRSGAVSGVPARRAPSRHDAASLARAFRPGRLAAAFLLAAFSFVLAPGASARGTDGIFYQPYVTNRVVLEGTGEVNNIYTSNRGTDIDPDTPGIQVRGIMYFATGCFAPRRPGTLAVTARIISGDRGAVGVVVRNNGALQCVYAWAKTDVDRNNDSVRVTATAVLTDNGTEVDRFEDTFTVEQRDTMSGVGESVGEGAPLDLTAPPPQAFTAGRTINVPALPAASGGSGSYSYALTGRGGAARPSWLGFNPATQRMTGTPQSAAGAVTLDYTVTDGDASVTQSFTVTVNAAPSLSAPSNRTFTAGTAFTSFILPAAMGGAPPLRYELQGLPGGLVFLSGTRRLTGTPRAPTASPVTVTYKVTDANGATDTDTFTVTVNGAAGDTTPPTGDTTPPAVSSIERQAPSGEDTNEGTLTFRVTFSEAVENVATTDFTVAAPGGGTATTATVTGVQARSAADDADATEPASVFRVTVSSGNLGSYEGTVGLGFATGQDIADEADNPLDDDLPAGANYETYTLDNTAPAVALTRADGLDTTLNAPFAVTVTFTEANGLQTTGAGAFIADDLDVTNGGATVAATSDPLVWTATVTPASDFEGNVLVDLPASRVQDVAGNANTAAVQLSVPVDTAVPTVTVTAPDNHDGTTAFDITVVFSEAVTDFDDAGDVAITGGTLTSGVSSITGSGTNYTVSVTPSGTADVTVQVPAGAATDGVNGNLASQTDTIDYVDSTAPTVVSVERHDGTAAQAEVTNADTLTFRVTFSEAMANVDAADFDASGAGDATGVTGSGSAYVVTVSGGNLGSYDGTVGLTFASGRTIADAAGNDLDATLPTDADYETYTVDNTGPAAALARADGLATTLSGAFDVTVTFTEANGLATSGAGAFIAGDLAVTNGSATAIATSDPPVWTATITPTSDLSGEVTVNLPAGRVQDAAGNDNTAAGPLTVPVDTAAPTMTSVTRSDPTAALTNADSLTWRVEFSEAVTVSAGAFGTNPAVAGASVAATEVSGSSGTAWEVELSGGTAIAGRNGAIALTLADASKVTDGAGNALTGGLASGAETYTHDNTAPTVVSVERQAPSDEDTNTNSLTFLVTFSEAVENVGTTDFAVAAPGGGTATTAGVTAVQARNAADTASATQPARVFRVTVSSGNFGSYDGTVGLGLVSSPTIADEADNVLTATTPSGVNQSYTVDNTAPTPALSAAPTTHDGSSTSVVTVDFAEAVTGFVVADITVTDGTKSGFTGASGASSYTVTVTPTGNADITVSVPAGVADDRAGNASLAAATDLTVDYEAVDSTAPTVSRIERQSPSGEDTNANSLTFRVTFSEDVENVGTTDFAVTAPGAGTATTASVTGVRARNVADTADATQPARVFRVTVSSGNLGSYEGAVGLDFATDQDIADAAGNDLVATLPTDANYETYTVDNTRPAVALARVDGLTTTLSGAFDVTVTFTEANGLQTTGDGAFIADDLDVTNGGATVAATADPLVWTATVTPASDFEGNVLVDLPASRVQDAAGNASTAAVQLSVPVDTAAPTVTVTAPDNHDGATAFDVTVVFSEAVTGFDDADDIAITGGALTGGASGITATGTNGTNYTVSVTPSGTADVTVQVPAGAATDGVNGSLASQTDTIDYVDSTAPTVVSVERHDGTAAQAEVTNADTLTFRVTFSEAVANVDAADFDASGTTATATNVSGSGAVYVVTVSGGNLAGYNGAVGLGFATDQNIADEADNALIATTPSGVNQTYTLDNTAPTITSITRVDDDGNDPGEHTNADEVKFRVDISEPVNRVNDRDFAATGLTGATVAVTNGTRGGVVTISGGNIADFNGVVGVGLDASRLNIEDGAGNVLGTTLPMGDDYETYTIDNAAPTPALSANPSTHDGSSTSEMTINFGEAVNGFVVGDVSVSGGTPSNFSGGDGDSRFTVTVTPTSGSTSDITVSVAADVADDLAGNANLAADDLTVTYSAPPVTLVWSAMLTVDDGSAADGYCSGTCSDDTFGNSVSGMLDDTDFTIPGGSTTVTVRGLTWQDFGGSPDLYLRPDSVPMSSVYDGWVLEVAGVRADFSCALTGGGVLRFLDFFTDATRPAAGTTVAVSISEGEVAGSCPVPDATLRDLSLTDVDDNHFDYEPMFASGTTAYTVTVANDVAVVTVEPYLSDATFATVAFDPATDADDQTDGHQVNLAVGENVITMTVTNGPSTQVYTLTVTREAAPLNWSARLTVELGSSREGYCGSDCNPNHGVDPHGTLTDTDFTIPGTGTSVTVGALNWSLNNLYLRLDTLPAASVYEDWTLTVDGVSKALTTDNVELRFSDTTLFFDEFFDSTTKPLDGATVDVCLTGDDGSSCPARDTTLSALTLTDAGGTDVALVPNFGRGATAFAAEVENSATTVTVAATANHSSATVAITPADADTKSGATGHQVSLNEGENTITVTVTHDGASVAHTLTVTREASAPAVIWSATLTVESTTPPRYGYNFGDNLVPRTFTPPGGVKREVLILDWHETSGDLQFTTRPDHPEGIEDWTLHIGSDSSRLIEASGSGVGYTASSFFAGTPPQSGTFTVCLTAGGAACEAPPAHTLRTLTLTDPDDNAVPLEPEFTAFTTSYTASVANSVATVTLAVTATDGGVTSLTFNSVDADDQAAGRQVALAEGENTITVTVTNTTTNEQTVYTITVTRAAGVRTLVSNTGQSHRAGHNLASSDSAQAFTTGGNAGGYTLTAVGVRFSGTGGDSSGISASVWSATADGQPNTSVGTLTNPGTVATNGTSQFTTSGLDLAANTTYIVVLDSTSAVNLTVSSTTMTREDTGAAGGWSIGDGSLFRAVGSTTTTWSTSNASQQIAIVGIAKTGTSGTEAPSSGLQARFGAQPAWHTGMAFWTELHFSAEPDLGYKDLRDKAFEVTGGRITRAQRTTKGSKRSWRLLVEPAGFGDISLTLPATENCAAEGAVCTAEGERLETGLALAVPGPGDRLAARLKGTASHTGEAFGLELHFNHEPGLRPEDVQGALFAVTGGRLTRAERLEQGSNLGWRLTVEPEGLGEVGLELPATKRCGAAGAVCTRDGRRLERGISWTVEGPAAFSVSDAEADEDAGAVLAFEVSLSRRLRAEARVDVATRDGTATAGADYEAVTRTLVFAPGETVKTVEVPVLDDAHDEGEETMALVLSNAKGALIDDGEGTGTIVNTDAIPKAWIARFGRTVTGQVLDAVEARLAAPRQAGGRMSLAGYPLAVPGGSGGSARTGADAGTLAQATPEDRAALAALGSRMDGTRTGRSQALNEPRDGGPEPKSLDITRYALVTGTAFTLTGGSPEDGGFASLWGHASVAGFDGREDALSLDGEVTTGFLGADWAAERWTAGLALGHSLGTGGYRNGECEADSTQSGGCGGRIEAALTGLYPYAGLDVTERVSVWLAGGHGAGELTVIPDGSGAIDTDFSMRMGAGGTRIAVLEPEGGEGLRFALKGDGRFTRTSSDAARAPDGGNLAEAEADVWLLRFGVEGSRPFALGGSGTGDDTGASLTPSFEVGVRRDGGDAETGFGADMGGGLALAAPERGLRFDLKGRALVAHEAPGFREWGASAGFGLDPRPSTERGLAMSLTQSWGASPSGGTDALLDRETLTGLATNDTGSDFEASSRLSGELGYGLPAFGGGFTGTPHLGFGLSSGGARDWRLGWRLTPAAPGASGFEVNLDATRRESARADTEHGVALRSRFRW